MTKKINDFDAICKPLFALKGIEKSTSYGTAAIKLNKKLLVRLREDNVSIAIKIDPDDRDKMLRDKPEVYFLTEHYLTSPFILARLSMIHPDELFGLVKREWLRMKS